MNEATKNETTDAVAGQVQRVVMRHPPKLGVSTLCRLMDDCLPEQIDDERDMQRLTSCGPRCVASLKLTPNAD